MSIPTVAILEDNETLLKDICTEVRDTELLEIIIHSTNSKDFLEAVRIKSPDCVLLDIRLSVESITGIDICNQIEKPTLFLSGETRDYYQNIEELNMKFAFPVMHLTKPITKEKLDKILPKFIKAFKWGKHDSIYLSINSIKTKVQFDDIAYIETVPNGKSNNKIIYFKNREPGQLKDFSLKKMAQAGFPEDQFIAISSARTVNIKLVEKVTSDEIWIKCIDESQTQKLAPLSVSQDKSKNVLSIFKKK